MDLFKHDLSISIPDWTAWLKELHSHHVSLNSPAFPQPISRPSASPHTIIRKSIENLMEVTDVLDGNYHNGTPEPVFYEFDSSKKEAEREQACADVDVLEFDLDEDGPLREEYLPRRRISSATRPVQVQTQERTQERTLPPPAKWSPAADEPILPAFARSQSRYVAPQPIARGQLSAAPAAPAVPAPFQQALDITRRIWPADEQVAYAPHLVPVYLPPLYNGYEYAYPPPLPPLTQTHSHSRSQSLSCNGPAAGQSQGHYRTYSQAQYDGRYPEFRYPEPPYFAASHPAPAMAQWGSMGRFDCPTVYPSVCESVGFHQGPLLKV